MTANKDHERKSTKKKLKDEHVMISDASEEKYTKNAETIPCNDNGGHEIRGGLVRYEISSIVIQFLFFWILSVITRTILRDAICTNKDTT
tara:strand:+ start:415 stop:684 length:270 start_codon:yes stop_codon:yes gene_type:complete